MLFENLTGCHTCLDTKMQTNFCFLAIIALLTGTLYSMDILSSDLLWSFFQASLQNYRHNTLLRPFPPGFLNADGEKDFTELKEIAVKVPQLNQVVWRDPHNQKAIQLLKWVLQPKLALKVAPDKKLHDIQRLVGEEKMAETNLIDFVFEIEYEENEEEKFQKLRADMDVFYAYHGSRTENFHSILRTGLRNNLNKVSLYGEGIYLSSDLRVSMIYSPTTKGWDQSLLGDSLSCVAVCEVIDHPQVRCSLAHAQKSSARSGNSPGDRVSSAAGSTCDTARASSPELHRRRSFIKGSEGGQIPEKYFVVRNDDLLRVKYLLVHAPNARKELIRRLSAGVALTKQRAASSAFRQLVRRHQFTFVMLLYVLVLATVGVLNSRSFSNWWREVTGSNDDNSFIQ